MQQEGWPLFAFEAQNPRTSITSQEHLRNQREPESGCAACLPGRGEARRGRRGTSGDPGQRRTPSDGSLRPASDPERRHQRGRGRQPEQWGGEARVKAVSGEDGIGSGSGSLPPGSGWDRLSRTRGCQGGLQTLLRRVAPPPRPAPPPRAASRR